MVSNCFVLHTFIVLCLINNGFGAIVNPPNNTLVVPCEGKFTSLRCESDTFDEVSWTYDGNTIISAPCQETRPDIAVVFAAYPKTTPSKVCNVNASLEEARLDQNIQALSGPYGCTDRKNAGITETAMVIELEPWCGLLSSCPVQEGDNVTIGCYGSYQWLAYLLQYNPVVTINSSIEFTGANGTYVSHIPRLLRPGEGPPKPIHMFTTYTIPNVTGGQQLDYTCRIQFMFTGRGYSPRNSYANNTLTWNSCRIKETVRYCPRHTVITPRSCEAGTTLTCRTNSYPAASYFWVDNLTGAITNGSSYVLPMGKYDLTCMAFIHANCTNGYYSCVAFPDNMTLEGYPFDSILNRTSTNYTIECSDNSTIRGFAMKCPNITLEAVNGSVYSNTSEIVLEEPSTVTFKCTYENPPPSRTIYRWSIDGKILPGLTASVASILIPPGLHSVQCDATIDISDSAFNETDGNCTCSDRRSTNVSVLVEATTTTVLLPTTPPIITLRTSQPTNVSKPPELPKPECCPFPHWPPIIPPIIAVLLSILMVPCYCYSCGPWSGEYWAEERRKLLLEERCYCMQHAYRRQIVRHNCKGIIPRHRALNGYGRL